MGCTLSRHLKSLLPGLLHGTCVLKGAGDTRAHLWLLSYEPLCTLLGLLTPFGSLASTVYRLHEEGTVAAVVWKR